VDKYRRCGSIFISPKARIGKNVSIGEGTRIAGNAVIEDGVTIGDYCKIGFDDPVREKAIIRQNSYYKDFLVAGNKCLIKKNTSVHDGARIFNKVTIGEGCRIGDNAFIRGHCKIGAGVTVGFCAYIGPFVEIAGDSVILNSSVIGSTSKIGKKVFISPCVMLAENKYMSISSYKKRKGPVIGDYVRIGCLSTIISCKIGRFSIIGANSVIAKDLPEGMVYFQGTLRKATAGEKKESLQGL